MKLYRPTLILLACAIGTNARIGTPFPSTAPTSEVNFKFIHDGHCASGWMGDNRQVETVDECATLCRERERCGYFAYDDSMTFSTNCATYLESGGCLDDKRFTEYTAYENVASSTPPTSDPSTAPTTSALSEDKESDKLSFSFFSQWALRKRLDGRKQNCRNSGRVCHNLWRT